MSITNALKKLRDDLSKAADNVRIGLSTHSLTEETYSDDGMALLADIQKDLKKLVTKLDLQMAKGTSRSRVVEFLNALLEAEYDAIFSYSYHALRVSDKELSGELLDIGQQEMQHFELLRDKIVSLGAEPKWKLTKYIECANVRPVELLHQHLKAEQEAIDLCKDGIAEGLDNALGGLLEKTIEDEQWHIIRLKKLIEKFEATGHA